MSNLLLTTENPTRKFYWRKIVPSDYEEVKQIMINHFVKWEPLSSTIGVTPETGALDLTNDSWAGVQDGQSICAYEPEDNNKIVAIRTASGPYSPDKRLKAWGGGKKLPLQLEQMYRFLECMSFGPEQVVQKYAGDEKFVKGVLVSVVEECFQLGLGRAILKKSWELAKEAGCKYFFAELTSAYTAIIFRKAGAKIIQDIPYCDYKDSVSGEKIMSKCKEPHVSGKTVVIDLDDKSWM